jgi:DegV family protein with EDD domain
MKVVTDAAANLSKERASELEISVVPFQVTFRGETYKDGVNILPEDLYRMYIEYPEDYCETSQPSVGDFIEVYRQHADEEILSIHLSSGLSGAYSSAEHAARITEHKNITVVDSRTVGPALGWMVETAARGAKLGWPKERILEAIKQVGENTFTMVAFTDMKYLLHSGRISHMKSLIATLLKIKPIIGMNKEDGRYSNLGQEMTLSRVAQRMGTLVLERFGKQKLRLQLMHGSNLPGVDTLRSALRNSLSVVEEQLTPVTLVLGAHAGPTVFGLAAAPQAMFDQLFG